MDQAEHFFTCPYCLENISMLLDLSVESQTFIEDCEVCCNPIEISYAANPEKDDVKDDVKDDDTEIREITSFSALKTQ